MNNNHVTAGQPVADYSADFEVEDVKREPRGPRDKDQDNGTGALHPRWQKNSRPKSNGSASLSTQSSVSLLPKQPIADLDPHRLAQRQKQIDYGKNTLGYQRYLQEVPKNKRRRKGDQWLDPVTPDIQQNISKRCFDGQVKVWRRALHKYDLQCEEEQEVKPLSFAERSRHANQVAEDTAVQSAVPSSPTNSSRSRGSLDGYLEPQIFDGGRKRCFQMAFDHVAGGNPNPSKLLTSPAGPRTTAPQSAPPATAADSEPGPTPMVGRCVDPPIMPGRTGGPPASLPKVPMTAPPRAAATSTVAGSTADAPGPPLGHRRHPSGALAAAVVARSDGKKDAGGSRGGRAAQKEPRGEDLFREWDEEDYAGLQPVDDDELEGVQL